MSTRLTAKLLGEGAGNPNSQPASLTSTSLPAIRAYLAGRAAIRNWHWPDAFRHFNEATLLDSTFTLAALEALHASYHEASSGETPEVGRAKRLARAGRERLGPGDRALLNIWADPWATSPELFQRWQVAAKEYPDRAEIWYGLGDAYYHDGMTAGLTILPLPPVPSSEAGRSTRKRAFLRPPSALPKLVTWWPPTTALGWYLRWHRALTFGDSAMRAFWADSQSMDPETFLAIHRFTTWTGVAPQEDLRAQELRIRQREIDAPDDAAFARHIRALDGGRPREAARLLFAKKDVKGVSAILPVREALYWGGDTITAIRALERLPPYPAAGPARGQAGMDQSHGVCTLATWHIARGDYPRGEKEIEWLRNAVVRGMPGDDSIPVEQYRVLCLALLEATWAHTHRRPDARAKLEWADSAARIFRVGQSLAANLVVARLAKAQGDLPLALRALRRRAQRYEMIPPWYLSTFLREEGRLAALTSDTAGAIRAYRHYLALRSDPEPEVQPEVDRVRRELVTLLREPDH